MSSLVEHLREHAARVAGGGAADDNYDPETLVLENDAADYIEALERTLAAMEFTRKCRIEMESWHFTEPDDAGPDFWDGELDDATP